MHVATREQHYLILQNNCITNHSPSFLSRPASRAVDASSLAIVAAYLLWLYFLHFFFVYLMLLGADIAGHLPRLYTFPQSPRLLRLGAKKKHSSAHLLTQLQT